MPKDYDNLREVPRHPNTQDLEGREFGLLTVREFAGYIGKYAAWWVECQCGKRFVRRAALLLNYDNQPRRNPQNCGCQRVNLAKQYGKSLYNTWNHLNVSGKLCPEWQADFTAFAQTLGERQGRFLTRPDKTKPMGPQNYAWAEEPKHRGVGEASRRLGITRQGLYSRLRHHSESVALKLPKRMSAQ